MSSGSQNTNVKHAIVLAVINFIYLMVSVMLLAPGIYLDDSTGLVGNGYGAASAVYSVGVLYSFFEKALSFDSTFSTKKKRIVEILAVLFAILNVVSIVAYYFIYTEPVIIYIGYGCIFLTAGLALFQAFGSALDFINQD